MSTDNFKNYLRTQQVSLQWLPVLRALATELSANASEQGLRRLFFKVGERFAKDVEARFAEVQTLEELEDELNQFWTQINWGWVNLAEADDAIEIVHQAAPIEESFGEEALPWSVGLLEGFYQTVFTVLGAGDGMSVNAVDGECGDMLVRLRFDNQAA